MNSHTSDSLILDSLLHSLPQPLAQALRGFAPQESEADHLHRQLAALRSDWQSLLRLPFEVEVLTRPASNHGPAEHADVYAHPDDVREAVDALIDRHIVELEADVKRRMAIRAGEEL